MKNISILIFFLFTAIGYSQNTPNISNKKNSNLFDIRLASGISTPSSKFSDNSYAGNGSFLQLSSNYYLSNIGVGLTIGQLFNPTEDNLKDFANQAEYNIQVNSEKWQTSYFGLGPSYKTNLGPLEAVIFGHVGIMFVKPISLDGNFTTENADLQTTVPVYSYNLSKTTNTSFYNAGISLGYTFNSHFGLHITANYLSAFTDKIIIREGTKEFTDINNDGVINETDIVKLDGKQVVFQYKENNIMPQFINYGLGLSYSFGKKDKNVANTKQSNPYFVDNKLVGNMAIKNSGSIVFTNTSNKENKKPQRIITILPKNNSVFKNVSDINNFSWKVIGEKIPNAKFIIEITKINKFLKPERSIVHETQQTSIKSSEIFKEIQLSDGRYMWKVTETSTGISSNPSYFTMSPCEINFSISNDSINCLGYEGENRKFKICFDATYQSNTGNLTYSNLGSGLTVFDQSYLPLTYTLVSPNPTLLTQIGATSTTVSYCFEVVVNNSVTSIGFGLQGDDLDPSPITCQPGVSANFNDLPDCLCDDCKDIELSFNNFNITPNGTSANQFNFNGNINVNVPIYGIEFQVQSYSYIAKPGPCTKGVTSVEESGMFLLPSTTINSSSSLQLFNETVSGSFSTNNNATKDIKYTSSSPLTGAIPINLTIGLPGPITGLDPSCCVIDYEVCIKVIIFYEDGSCKSCDFNHCFQFNNQ